MNEYNLSVLITIILMGAVSNMRSQNPGVVLGSRGYINDYLSQDNTCFGDKTDEDLSWDEPPQSTKLPYDYFRTTYTSPNDTPGSATTHVGNTGDNMSFGYSSANNGDGFGKVTDFSGPSFERRNNKDLFYSETDNYMLTPGGQNGDSTNNSAPQDENLIKRSNTGGSIYGTYTDTGGMIIPGLSVDDSSDGLCWDKNKQTQISNDFTGPVFDNYAPNYAMGEDDSDINDSNSADNTDRVNSNTFPNKDFKGPVFNNYKSNEEEMPGINLSSNSVDEADSYGDSNLEPFKVNQPITSYFYGPVLANQGLSADSAINDTPDMETSKDNIDNSFSHESGNGLGITSFVGPVFGNYADNQDSMPGNLSQGTNQSSNIQNQTSPANTSQTQNSFSTQNDLSTTPNDSSNGKGEINNQSANYVESQAPIPIDTNNPTSIPRYNYQSQNSDVVPKGDSQSTGEVTSPVDDFGQNLEATHNYVSNASIPSQNEQTASDNSLSYGNGNLNQFKESQNNSMVTPVGDIVSSNPLSKMNANGSNDQSQSSLFTDTSPITSTPEISQGQDNRVNPINANVFDVNNPDPSSAYPNKSTSDATYNTSGSQNNDFSNNSQPEHSHNVVFYPSETQKNVNVVTQNTPDSSYDNTNPDSSIQSVPSTSSSPDVSHHTDTVDNSSQESQISPDYTTTQDIFSDTLLSKQDTSSANDQQNLNDNNQVTSIPIQPQDTIPSSVSTTHDQSNPDSSGVQSASTADTSKQTVSDANLTHQNILSNTTPVTGDSSNDQANLITDNQTNQPISTDSSNVHASNSPSSNPSIVSPEPNQIINISDVKDVQSTGTSISSSNSSTVTTTGLSSSGTSLTDTSVTTPSSNGSNSSSTSSNNTGAGSTPDTKFLSTNELPINSVNTSVTKSVSTTIKANIKLCLLAILFIGLL